MGVVAGNSGACCTCDQFVSDGCSCNGGIACSLDCRSKGGFAVLCGFSEFVNPSDPPKKYLTLTGSGTITHKIYFNRTDCSGTPSVESSNVNTGSANYNPGPCTVDCSAMTEQPCGRVNVETFVDQTTSTTTGAGCQVLSGIHSRDDSGENTNSLSNEDTEAAAVERAQNAITDWSDCSLGNSAFITDRSGVGGFSFGFRKIQTKVHWTAIVGRTYDVRVNFSRRLLGSVGPFLDLGQPYETSITAGVVAEFTDWIDVPNEAGWETVASNCVVTIQPA